MSVKIGSGSSTRLHRKTVPSDGINGRENSPKREVGNKWKVSVKMMYIKMEW